MRYNIYKLYLTLTTVLFLGIFFILYSNVAQLKIENLTIAQQNELKITAGKLENIIFNNTTNIVQTLSRSRDLQLHLVSKRSTTTTKILTILEAVKTTTSANIVYMMNKKGTVVASTVSDDSNLLHNNYFFRPYFIQALYGDPVIYPAVGITTDKRGIYFSSPVKYNRKIIGVIVIKLGLSDIDAIIKSIDKPTVLVSKDGVVFSTNRDRWLYKTLTNLPAETIALLKQNRQFANITLKSLNFVIEGNRAYRNNKEYRLTQQDISIKNWKMISLYPDNDAAPLTSTQRNVIISIISFLIAGFIFINIMIIFSYKKFQAEQKYRLVVENVNEGILILGSSYNTLFYNDRFLNIIEYSDDEFKDINFLNMIEPTDKTLFTSSFTFDKHDLYSSRYTEFNITTLNNKKKWIYCSSVRVLWNSEHAVLLFLIDNTAKKQAEKELIKNERKYRLLIESMDESVIILDNEQKIAFVNNSFYRLINYHKPVYGTTLDTLFDGKNNIYNFIQTPKIESDTKKTNQWEWTDNNGNKRICIVNESVLQDDLSRVTGSILVVSDHTTLHMLQEKLVKSEKLELIGQLAGGVAHDLNNILTGLVSIPDLLIRTVDDNDIIASLNIIKNSGEKAAAIVNDLLTLARRQVSKKEPVNFNTIINNVLDSHTFFTIQSLHTNVEVTCKLDQSLHNISGSSLYLENAVMNLISNSMEAMPDGGPITIRTFNEFNNNDPHIVVQLSDSGIGISTDDQKKIFEPFYTKKVMGRSGTGLGLTIVWGTIKDHNGTIDISNNPTGGTVFTIKIPATFESIKPRQTELKEQLTGNRQKILIVDDEKIQCDLAESILEKFNYSPFTALNQEEALNIFNDHHIELVLIDMVLEQGKTGLDLFMELKKIDPDIKVICITGYAETELIDKAKILGIKKIIKKPYTINTLVTEIYDSLHPH